MVYYLEVFYMKRILSVTLALLLLMTCIPLGMVGVSAADYEYAYFPGSVLKVTQGAYGEFNSYSHNGQGGYYQNAFDLGGNSNYCAPFSGTITSIKTSYNAVVLQSDNMVYWANGTLDYMSVTFVHDNDISDLYVGKHIAQGEVFYQPGIKDPGGYTTGTHLHLCVNRGKTTEGIRYFSGDTRPNEALFLKDSVTVQQTGNYTWKKTSTPTPPATSYGTYYIKNAGNGKYLDVANATDANKQNIQAVSFNGSNAQKYEIAPSTTTAGYSMRPLSSATRMVNVYGDTVSSGKNVCIWDNTGDASQRWNFEKVSGGYIIRNVQNSNCVLDVESNGNVYVSTYTGATTQIWTFQDVNCVHTYDHACDSNCNKCGMWRSVSGHNWTSATCTAPATCTICGTTEGSALSHTWVDATCIVAKTCTVCGTTEGDVSGHNWDADTGRCTICGETVSTEYSEWTEELPDDVTEELFDIESKAVYRYRDNSSHVVYGDWSGEKTSTTKPAESDTLTIVSTKTYYNYYHYCCNYYGGTYNVDSILHGTGGQYHTIRLTYELTAKNVGDMGGKTLYGNYTCSKNFQVWAKADQYITHEYTYKTRTKTDVVDYGAWSEWADAEPSAAANRNVETKTLYRYKLKRVQTAYASDVQHSVMDTDNGIGLAFRFELSAKGVTKDKRNLMDLSDATVNYLGVDCKLIGMGAIVTNNDAEAVNLTLEDVNDYNVVNVPTVYVQEANEESCAFAARIIDIPADQSERVIYARAYFVVEVDGEQITVYGDVDAACCADYM